MYGYPLSCGSMCDMWLTDVPQAVSTVVLSQQSGVSHFPKAWWHCAWHSQWPWPKPCYLAYQLQQIQWNCGVVGWAPVSNISLINVHCLMCRSHFLYTGLWTEYTMVWQRPSICSSVRPSICPIVNSECNNSIFWIQVIRGLASRCHWKPAM